MKTRKIKNLTEIILYGILVLMGIIIMSFPAFGLINPPHYLGSLFFIYAFFATIAYFVYRKENEYEILFNALISIVTGTFLFSTSNTNVPFVLGTGLLIFMLLTVVNKSYSTYKAKENNNYMWIVKFLITCIIAFLGFLTIINLYSELSVQTLILGYFFITLGIMSVIEPLITYFVNPDKISKVLKAILNEEWEIKVIKKEKTKNVKKKVVKKTNKKSAKK